MSDLSSRALLVALNISQWAGRRLDRKVSEEVAVAKRASRNAGNYSKRLLPTSMELDAVHKLTGSIRTEYYKLTLPWMEGLGIIKADAYLGFTQRFASLKSEWDTAVTRFLDGYEDAIEDARHQLGDLFDAADYPSLDDMRSRFRLDIAFYPVPSPDDCDRVAIVGDMAESWARELADQLAEKEHEAMRKAWQRVHEVVERAHERLSDPDNIFRNSLIENARELCDLLPSLNITDDPELEKMRWKLEAALCSHDPDDLRENTDLRASVSSELAALMAKMGPMYAEAA